MVKGSPLRANRQKVVEVVVGDSCSRWHSFQSRAGSYDILMVDVYAHCTVDHTVTENMLSFVQLLAIEDLFYWNSE